MTLHVENRNEAEEALEGYELVDGGVWRLVAAKSSTILETLREGREKIREFFGEDARARLSIKTDPEIQRMESAVVEIFVAGDVDNALERMERFDFGWWLAASGREKAEVCFLAFPR